MTDRTERRVALIKRVEVVDKKLGFIGRHGIEMMTEDKLEQFVKEYEQLIK